MDPDVLLMDEPFAVTKMIPPSVSPNQRIASGTQAIEGIDCNPKTKEPTVWLITSIRAMKIPRITPPVIAIANPIDNLHMLVAIP